MDTKTQIKTMSFFVGGVRVVDKGYKVNMYPFQRIAHEWSPPLGNAVVWN